MRAPARPLLAGVAALAAALAGCGGISDPYNTTPSGTQATPTTATTATQAPVTVQRPGMGPMGPDDPPPRPQRIDESALSDDAAATIERYAGLVGTWTWKDVAARYRQAAALALDGARADAAQAAAEIPKDPRYELEQVRQTTRLEGILQRGGTSERPRYVVVQRRRIELRATPPSDAWVITIAVLRRAGAGWAVSQWDDQG